MEPNSHNSDHRAEETLLFAKNFPNDPALNALLRAFRLGNHHYVRTHAAEVAASSENEAVKQAADELRRRIQPDRIAYVLYALTALLLLTLTLWAIAQSRRTQALHPLSFPSSATPVTHSN